MGIEPRVVLSVRFALLAGCVLLGARAEAQHYTQTNVVSNQPGAAVMDANLVNPWGLSRSSTSPWWVANNGTGTSTLYNGNTGAAAALIVTIPPAPGSSDPGVPTGTVFNGTTAFQLTPGSAARFLFVTEDGTISGWNPAVDATHAIVKVTSPGAVYKGVAIASRGGAWFLYVTNFARRRIEVFGYVDVFSPSGRLLRRLQHGPWLNGPWGLALAPGDFGAFSHNLLVGQFGSGEIAAYDVATGAFLGEMRDTSDHVLEIEGLWALAFGNGASAGPLNTLFFTAGINDEEDGLFGTLTAVTAEQLLGNGQ